MMGEREQFALDVQCRRLRTAIFVFAGLAIAGPAIGILTIVGRLILVFDKAGMTGGTDPGEFAGEISMSYKSGWFGGLVFILGFIGFVICLVQFLRRKNEITSEKPPLPSEKM